MEKEHDKIGTRLGLIITKLNNGERFTAEELANEFNVNVRTIQRDLNERLSDIPIIEATQYQTTFDGKTFTRGVKMSFGKIEKLIFEEN